MNMQQHFPIQGMTCGNCVRHVEQALNKLSGISKLEVNLEKTRPWWNTTQRL